MMQIVLQLRRGQITVILIRIAVWNSGERPMFILKIIFCFLLPPVTAYLCVGTGTHFWINIALTLLGGLPGIIHALWLTFTGAKS
jgi:uncharacterized membrane protein YqaE (UPF0057 family)